MNNKNESTLAARLRNERAFSLLMTADAAAQLVKDGMTIGVSGFTPSGYPKAVPLALAERAKKGDKFKVDLYTGASVGPEIDSAWTQAFPLSDERLTPQGYQRWEGRVCGYAPFAVCPAYQLWCSETCGYRHC